MTNAYFLCLQGTQLLLIVHSHSQEILDAGDSVVKCIKYASDQFACNFLCKSTELIKIHAVRVKSLTKNKISKLLYLSKITFLIIEFLYAVAMEWIERAAEALLESER